MKTPFQASIYFLEMTSESSWILLCLVLFSVGVTTRSMNDYYDLYDYDEALFQRSNTQQSVQESEEKNITLRMPDVHPEKHDSYFCTSLKMSDSDTYIVGYTPHAEMATAHHMLLFGCENPASKDKFWNCGDMGAGVCAPGSQEQIMYAWGRNAPVLKLPKDVAFQVGGSSVAKYLVLQVHYGHVDKFKKNPSLNDNSGVTIETTKKRPGHFASILLSASGGSIPPHKTAWHLDVGCQYNNNPAIINPFAFRVHTHSLGTVVSGYRVRNGKWTLIGKNDPQLPQAFYPLKNAPKLKEGDYLATRCTYNSMSRKTTTHIGATMKDEMCNFYLMFYYDPSLTNLSPENSCSYMPENVLEHFPLDSDKPIPDSGQKMEMKRDFPEDELCLECKRSPQKMLTVQQSWPLGGSRDGELPFKSGQVSGVSMDSKGNVVIFHRGSRSWKEDTFNLDNKLKAAYRAAPIPEDTVAWLDAETGKIKGRWGAGKFYLPHGITVDKHDNLWLTDVGMHQVFKYGPSGKALITLGTKLEPGSDLNHFCKPTGVAIDSDGNFFVSDGYCNERVLKYAPDGKVIMMITKAVFPALFSEPYNSFRIPHSVSIDNQHDQLYVADRENGRVLVFNSKTGMFVKSLTGFGSRVFAAHYNPADGGLLHVVNGFDYKTVVSGYTYSIADDKIIQTWKPTEGFTEPHDVTSNSKGDAVYVAEISPHRIWKFIKA